MLLKFQSKIIKPLLLLLLLLKLFILSVLLNSCKKDGTPAKPRKIVADMPTARLQSSSKPGSDARLVASGNKVYSIGGYFINPHNNNYAINVSPDVEAYDIGGGAWIKRASLNTKRHATANAAFNGNIHVASGAVWQPNFPDVPISILEVISID